MFCDQVRQRRAGNNDGKRTLKLLHGVVPSFIFSQISECKSCLASSQEAGQDERKRVDEKHPLDQWSNEISTQPLNIL
jgi:hypothetical protein